MIGIQEIIVMLVVLASVLYLVRKFTRAFSGNGSCNTQCGCAKQNWKASKQA